VTLYTTAVQSKVLFCFASEVSSLVLLWYEQLEQVLYKVFYIPPRQLLVFTH